MVFGVLAVLVACQPDGPPTPTAPPAASAATIPGASLREGIEWLTEHTMRCEAVTRAAPVESWQCIQDNRELPSNPDQSLYVIELDAVDGRLTRVNGTVDQFSPPGALDYTFGFFFDTVPGLVPPAAADLKQFALDHEGSAGDATIDGTKVRLSGPGRHREIVVEPDVTARWLRRQAGQSVEGAASDLNLHLGTARRWAAEDDAGGAD
jgi:hypothetical protein